MPSSEAPDVLDRGEAAEYLRISLSELGYLIASERVPSFKLGRRRLFRRSSLDAWMAMLETGRAPSSEMIA